MKFLETLGIIVLALLSAIFDIVWIVAAVIVVVPIVVIFWTYKVACFKLDSIKKRK